MADLSAIVAWVVIVAAVAWVACYAHPATRPAARLLWAPLAVLGALAALLLAGARVLSPRSRREPEEPAPPSSLAPGAATGFAERLEADRADSESRRATREAIRRAVEARDPSAMVERERELRKAAGLPPLD